MKHVIVASVLSACWLAGPQLAQAGGKTKHKSPQAAFAAMQNAAKKKEWKRFMQCMTPRSQNMLTGGMVMAGAMMKKFAAFSKGKIDVEKIDGVLKKHKLTEEKLKNAQLSFNPKANQEKAMAKLASLVKNKGQFVAEMMEAIGAEKQNKGLQNLANSRLEDVKIDGDRATAKVVTENNGNVSRQPLEFRNMGGGWLIELPNPSATKSK